MDFGLNDRQSSLQKLCEQFFATESPPDVVRRMERALGAKEGSAEQGLHARIWSAFTRLGALRLTLAKELGGDGRGQSDAIIVAEQIGRVLYQSPYPDTLTTVDILQATTPTATQQSFLRRCAYGESSAALAVREHGRANPANLDLLTMPIIPQSEGWTTTGEKRFVSCAGQASHILLAAISPDGPMLFLVPRDRPGISARRHDEIGRGELFALTFDSVRLTREDLVGTMSNASELYTHALARARMRHAAYLVGLCQALFDITLQYTKERKQFSRPIASFQAIAFRLAAFAARIDAARVLTHYVAWQTDRREDIRRIAGELLAMVGDLTQELAADAVQMHGAFGLTEQAEAQRYYRRAAVDTMLLGMPVQLRDEAALLLAQERSTRAGN